MRGLLNLLLFGTAVMEMNNGLVILEKSKIKRLLRALYFHTVLALYFSMPIYYKSHLKYNFSGQLKKIYIIIEDHIYKIFSNSLCLTYFNKFEINLIKKFFKLKSRDVKELSLLVIL